MRGLIVGLANDQSLAWGCATTLRAAGAELALTYLNDRAKRFVEPLAQQVGAEMLLPLDVTAPDQMDALFDRVASRWGGLDFLLHSIAFAPKEDLHGRVTDSSADGFASGRGDDARAVVGACDRLALAGIRGPHRAYAAASAALARGGPPKTAGDPGAAATARDVRRRGGAGFDLLSDGPGRGRSSCAAGGSFGQRKSPLLFFVAHPPLRAGEACTASTRRAFPRGAHRPRPSRTLAPFS